jgi:hypothetical protein
MDCKIIGVIGIVNHKQEHHDFKEGDLVSVHNIDIQPTFIFEYHVEKLKFEMTRIKIQRAKNLFRVIEANKTSIKVTSLRDGYNCWTGFSVLHNWLKKEVHHG